MRTREALRKLRLLSLMSEILFILRLGEKLLDPLLTSAIDEAFHALSLYNEKTQPNQVLADALKSMDVLDKKYKVQQL